ncbi:hypothetical protein GCM10007928_05740 [Sulfitobacter porphyrae]|nr:hypothetical protein GCM10007928_05740 [Sulfitobacter porphyrae]
MTGAAAPAAQLRPVALRAVVERPEIGDCGCGNCWLEQRLSVSARNQKGIRHRSAGEPELPPQL